MSNYDKYIFKKNECFKKRINQNTKLHDFHNKFNYRIKEAK